MNPQYAIPAALALLGAYVIGLPAQEIRTDAATGVKVTGPVLSIKDIAELVTPAIATAKTDYARALLLRTQIHRSALPVDGIPAATGEDLADLARAYRLSVLEGSRGNSCNGKAILFIAALQAYGIDARAVALYADKAAGTMAWSHSTVDVKIGEAWLAMDPTFNVSFLAENGRALGWREVVARAREDKYVFPYSDGGTVLSERSLKTVSDILGYTLKGLSQYALLGPWREGEAENLTPGWDGKVSYATGETYDAWAGITSDFYAKLSGRPVND